MSNWTLGDVFLEGRDGNGAGELLAPAPDQVQALAEHGGECIDVLVPGAVEVGEEEQVIVLKAFADLAVAEIRERVGGNDDPAGELDEGEVDEVLSASASTCVQSRKKTVAAAMSSMASWA